MHKQASLTFPHHASQQLTFASNSTFVGTAAKMSTISMCLQRKCLKVWTKFVGSQRTTNHIFQCELEVNEANLWKINLAGR